MPDIFDQAQERDQQQLAESLAAQAARAAASPKLEATGNCLNPLCGEDLQPLASGVMPLFCGADCAKKHAYYSK
jgi:hypothetical protein